MASSFPTLQTARAFDLHTWSYFWRAFIASACLQAISLINRAFTNVECVKEQGAAHDFAN